MNLSEQLAALSMEQLLIVIRELPPDAPMENRLSVVRAASSLLERIEVKSTVVTRIGDHLRQGAAESPA